MPINHSMPPKAFPSNSQRLSADPLSPTGRRFRLHWPSALAALFVASLAITLYMLFVPRWLGIEEMDIGITIGLLTDPNGGVGAYLGRLAWHVGNSVLYIMVYIAILLFLQKQSDARTGLIFGVFLWFFGPMLLIPVLLNFIPSVWYEGLTNPGIFMLDLGLGYTPAAVDLGAHLAHGLLTGVIYKHTAAQGGLR